MLYLYIYAQSINAVLMNKGGYVLVASLTISDIIIKRVKIVNEMG